MIHVHVGHAVWCTVGVLMYACVLSCVVTLVMCFVSHATNVLYHVYDRIYTYVDGIRSLYLYVY